MLDPTPPLVSADVGSSGTSVIHRNANALRLLPVQATPSLRLRTFPSITYSLRSHAIAIPLVGRDSLFIILGGWLVVESAERLDTIIIVSRNRCLERPRTLQCVQCMSDEVVVPDI